MASGAGLDAASATTAAQIETQNNSTMTPLGRYGPDNKQGLPVADVYKYDPAFRAAVDAMGGLEAYEAVTQCVHAGPVCPMTPAQQAALDAYSLGSGRLEGQADLLPLDWAAGIAQNPGAEFFGSSMGTLRIANTLSSDSPAAKAGLLIGGGAALAMGAWNALTSIDPTVAAQAQSGSAGTTTWNEGPFLPPPLITPLPDPTKPLIESVPIQTPPTYAESFPAAEPGSLNPANPGYGTTTPVDSGTILANQNADGEFNGDGLLQSVENRRRYSPGVASSAGNLPTISQDDDWLRGTNQNAGRVPQQIADKLSGQHFESFDDFRKMFWKEVAKDPVLTRQFGAKSIDRMKLGLAPLAHEAEWAGQRKVYELDHMEPIGKGGNIYDMNNIIIRTPYNHIRGK